MIVTQLEGTVQPDQWDTLKRAFHDSAQQLPAAIGQSFLIQDQAMHNTWRILTVWKSEQALQEYRSSIETPGGVLFFRAAGAEPTLSIYKVIDRAEDGTDG